MAFGAASRLLSSCLLSLTVVGSGCAGSAAPLVTGSEELASGGEALDLSSLAEENDALHDRVDDLESRLARVEAQNEELRVALGRATEGRAVRIGGAPTVHEEPELTVEPEGREARSGRAIEPESEGDPEIDGAGSRPLLTLHGPPVISLPSVETRPALASASPLAGPPAPSTALPPPAGSLGRLLVTGSPSDVPAIPTAPVTVLSAAPTETDSVALEYQAALRRLSERDLTGALEALGRFATAHPEHPYADNALYFRGEIHYAGHQWRAAIDELEQLVVRYPHGGRVADALLRIGMCWERLGDSARAERYFVRVRTEHPESSAARMAEREDTLMAAHDRTHADASALGLVLRFRSKALAAGLASATLLSGLSPARLSAQSDSFVDDGDDGDSIYGEGDRPSDRVRLAGSGTRAIPPTHTVRRGDTLWDVTGHYYGNPWEWPRVWSYNPEVTNPHWIYPDDVLRLLPGGVAPVVTSGGVRVVSRGSRGEGSVYLREQGYLDVDALRNSGEIIGSPSDHMLLSPYDEVYVRFDELDGGRPPAGEYTIFRELAEGIENEREAGDTGTLVRILGAVRVDEWDEERRTARATITEALDPIERGYRIAAIPRRFAVVPPVPADRDLESEVVASLRPSLLIGAEQIVFVSVGEEDGVRDGNRFFIVRSGDEWRRTLESSDGHEHGAALALPASPEEWPEEVIAEGRVVALRPHSAGLFITRSVRVVERGDRAEMRRGY